MIRKFSLESNRCRSEWYHVISILEAKEETHLLWERRYQPLAIVSGCSLSHNRSRRGVTASKVRFCPILPNSCCDPWINSRNAVTDVLLGRDSISPWTVHATNSLIATLLMDIYPWKTTVCLLWLTLAGTNMIVHLIAQFISVGETRSRIVYTFYRTIQSDKDFPHLKRSPLQTRNMTRNENNIASPAYPDGPVLCQPLNLT